MRVASFLARLVSFALLAASPVRAAAPADTSATDDSPAPVSGLVQEPQEAGQRARQVVDVVTYVPRAAVGALFYGVIWAEVRATDPRFVEPIREIFWPNERRLVWYPRVWVSSGEKPGWGAGAAWRGDDTSANLGGVYSSRRRWIGDFRLAHDFTRGSRNGRITLDLRAADRTDLEFHGFGPDPGTDPRNGFTGNEGTSSYARYGQRLATGGIVGGLRFSRATQVFGTLLYRRREIGESAPGALDDLPNVLDPAGVPGYGETGEQVYGEIALEQDTREIRAMMSPGRRTEVWGGLSLGVDGDRSRFVRAGVDAAWFLPVIRRNRLVVPRLVFHAVEKLPGAGEISFADYPRHHTFRGTSGRVLLRTDSFVAVPSLAYQWPLSHLLRATLFTDWLFVAPELDELTTRSAPWAAGFELGAVLERRIAGSVMLAGGSEGFRAAFALGFDLADDRTKWN
jgi:hypothetical protein